MTKVLVLYYSAYGHIEAMANAVAEGARETGATVDIKRVPELVPVEVARASHYKLDQAAPVAKVEDLADYDAIIVGTGTRFGRISSQIRDGGSRSCSPASLPSRRISKSGSSRPLPQGGTFARLRPHRCCGPR